VWQDCCGPNLQIDNVVRCHGGVGQTHSPLGPAGCASPLTMGRIENLVPTLSDRQRDCAPTAWRGHGPLNVPAGIDCV